MFTKSVRLGSDGAHLGGDFLGSASKSSEFVRMNQHERQKTYRIPTLNLDQLPNQSQVTGRISMGTDGAATFAPRGDHRFGGGSVVSKQGP